MAHRRDQSKRKSYTRLELHSSLLYDAERDLLVIAKFLVLCATTFLNNMLRRAVSLRQLSFFVTFKQH